MENDKSYYLQRILTSSVYDIAIKTPLDYAKNISERLNNKIHLKREDLQPVFSFKIRGAYNKISKIPRADLYKGVITASAGNHAQGVALSAQILACKSVIVMPITTPNIKVEAVAKYGAEIILSGESFSDAYLKAMEIAAERKMIYVPPFDDPDVIAGQGTIAMEIISQHPQSIDAIFVPIGGGGLAAGIAVYIKAIKPDIKVIGVQAEDSNAMYQSLQSDKIIELESVGLFADGTAVKKVGEETFKLCKQYLDEIILVNTDDICASIQDIFNDTRTIVEPSGALSLAGLKSYVKKYSIENQILISINSGSNMNFHRLRHVSERTELSEKKETILAVTIPELPGSFLNFINVLGNRNITEFNYRYGNKNQAHIFVGIETNNSEDSKKIIHDLKNAQLTTTDLSSDEIAKIHVRYMVGGRTELIDNEVIYTFEFPERPGALKNFLKSMQSQWNITLFHYRNHGSDYGRVIIGFDVRENERSKLTEFLLSTGFIFIEQTNNKAYQLFLK